MKILHLIDSLEYNGHARQLALLAPALAEEGVQVEVCCLGPETPWAMSLREAGVPVHILGWTRWFDFSVLWTLREILRDRSFDLIHVWRLPALRSLAVVAKGLLPRVVMSEPTPARETMSWWDRRLLHQVHRLPFTGVQKTRRESFLIPKTTPDPFSWSWQIACVGKLEHDDGFRQAIWAIDFLRYVYPNANLKLVGAGSQLAVLQALTEGLGNATSVQFLGARADADAVLRDADVVWLPTLANGGRQVALEAMALGKPVIASDVPCLREILKDGETGFLVPPGNVLQLARRTRTLCNDAGLRARIGMAAQDHVERHFSLAEAVRRWRDFYGAVAA